MSGCRRRGPTALASQEGPDGGAAEPRPPCPTCGAPGRGGSGVPIFSHPVAGSTASNSRRRANGVSRAPSILDWPAAAGGGARRAVPAEGRVQDEGGAVRGWSLKEWGEGEAGLGRRGIRGIQELGEVEHARASRCSVEGQSSNRRYNFVTRSALCIGGFPHLNDCIHFHCHYFKISIVLYMHIAVSVCIYVCPCRGVQPASGRPPVAQDAYQCRPTQNCKFTYNLFFYSSVFVSVYVFNVWPKTTLLPVWPRDAKRLDTWAKSKYWQ